jgi:integrase
VGSQSSYGGASLKYVTLKTVFLVALATAQRRSELHALSYENISFNKVRGEVQLAPVPGFLAKNQAPVTSRRPVIIPSLSETVDKTFPDRTLCPVRALKFYVDRTRPPAVRLARQHLFISYAEGYSKEMLLPLFPGGSLLRSN